LFGGTGNDTLYGDSIEIYGQTTVVEGNDFIDGGDGNDDIAGGGGSDTLLGGIRVLRFKGEAANDGEYKTQKTRRAA